MNKIVISGRLCRDAELRYTPQGTPVASFRFAVIDRRSRVNQEKTVFLDVNLFGQRAETLHKYLTRGKLLLVEGSLDVTQRKTEDGRTYTNVRVYANEIEFLGRKEEGAAPSAEGPEDQETEKAEVSPSQEIPQDETEEEEPKEAE